MSVVVIIRVIVYCCKQTRAKHSPDSLLYDTTTAPIAIAKILSRKEDYSNHSEKITQKSKTTLDLSLTVVCKLQKYFRILS